MSEILMMSQDKPNCRPTDVLPGRQTPPRVFHLPSKLRALLSQLSSGFLAPPDLAREEEGRLLTADLLRWVF